MKIYEKIVAGRIRWPSDGHVSPEARDLISGLCTLNPSQRLGNIAGGSESVKKHAFFKGIDWEKLYYREMKGPIIPRVEHPADARNFDDYGDPEETKSVYTREMEREHESSFKDF